MRSISIKSFFSGKYSNVASLNQVSSGLVLETFHTIWPEKERDPAKGPRMVSDPRMSGILSKPKNIAKGKNIQRFC